MCVCVRVCECECFFGFEALRVWGLRGFGVKGLRVFRVFRVLGFGFVALSLRVLGFVRVWASFGGGFLSQGLEVKGDSDFKALRLFKLASMGWGGGAVSG